MRRCECDVSLHTRRRSPVRSISSAWCCPIRTTSTRPAWSCSMPEPSPLLVPQMNVNDEHAVIVAWHVDSGTRVEAEQVIATLETTKATFDVQADRAGFLLYEHEVKSLVQVGAPLAWIGDSADAQVTQ